MEKSDDIKIFSLCYAKKGFNFIDDSVVTPLQVGADVTKADICELKDNTGDNISGKNYFYIENTGTYWIWKNVSGCKYKGQMQYRRPLIGVNEKFNFERIFKVYDVITVIPYNYPKNSIPKKPGMPFIPAQTVEEGYKFSNCILDLQRTEAIIKELYPDYASDYDKYIKKGQNLYYSNGFIMKSEKYDEYCGFLFSILDEFVKRYNINDKDSLNNYVLKNVQDGGYQTRYKEFPQGALQWQSEIGGFLSERIWTLWLLHNIDHKKIYNLAYDKQENMWI